MIKATKLFLLIILSSCFCSLFGCKFDKRCDYTIDKSDGKNIDDYDVLDVILKNKLVKGYVFNGTEYINEHFDGSYAIIESICLPLDLYIYSYNDSKFDVQIFNESTDNSINVFCNNSFYKVPSNTSFGLVFFSFDYRLDFISFEIKDDYYIDKNLSIKKINSEFLGELCYPQTFSIYNNHIYSSDGNNIGIQDMNFNDCDNYLVDTGHSNSMQISEDGFAYISGWNDNKLYEVDLNTYNIDIIHLPVKGYSTCAINTEEKVAFIFYREDEPYTYANYKCVIFDYLNKIVIKKIELKFEFLVQQSCFYYDGYIYLLWGLGNDMYKNGFAILNNECDLVATYHLPSFEMDEPEGIYVDDNQVLISFYNKKVFKLNFE